MNTLKPGTIANLIRAVHEELISAQLSREQQKLDPLLQLESIEIEIKFVTVEVDELSGKIGVALLNVGANDKYQIERAHTLKVKAKLSDPSAQLGPRIPKGAFPAKSAQ